MKTINFKGYQDFEVYTRIYDEIKKPIGIVQIIHGMQEHGFRYDNFCKFLEKNNYIVYISDLRGHGKTIKNNEPQGYSKGDISKENIADQIMLSQEIKCKYPNLPLIVMGHSYGSFLLQNYITQCDCADKIILSGSAYSNTIIMKLGKIISKLTGFFKGNQINAKMIEKMSFKSYSKGFDDGNWLCRDENIWKKYNEDEFCGKSFPVSFYNSFFKLLLSNYKHLDKINKKMPIYIMSGEEDPVGEKGKMVKKLYDIYNSIGLNVVLKLYPECRHELLNELNKELVYSDILDFLNKN